MRGLRLGLGIGRGGSAAERVIAASTVDGEVVVTDLGGGEFSYTVSGSSITAFNGTYTQDVQARTLTGALLESERVLWLVAPAIEIATDVASNGLADAGDTLGKTHLGLAIYDPDQGIPAAATFQWRRDGSAISGQTDPDALLLGALDFESDMTLAATFGGQTAVSSAITVELGSAMDADLNALFKYTATNATLSGSDVTGWNDESGEGHNFVTTTAGLRPTYDAVNGCVQFRSATPGNLRTVGDGPMGLAVSGGAMAVFFVVDPVGSVATQTMLVENSGTGLNHNTRIGIDTSGGDLDFYYFNKGSGASLAKFGNVTSALTSDPPAAGLGKALIRYSVDGDMAYIHVNGVQKWSGALVEANEFAESRLMQIGSAATSDGSSTSRPSDVDVYHLFGTTSLELVSAIESELTTLYGPF